HDRTPLPPWLCPPPRCRLHARCGSHGRASARPRCGCIGSCTGDAGERRCAGARAAQRQREPLWATAGGAGRHPGRGRARLPLTADFRHDLPRMLEAAATAGLVYVCNPNNPTASVTPAAEVAAFLAAVPASTTVLVDEAYHHFASGGGYESVIAQVAQRPNLV